MSEVGSALKLVNDVLASIATPVVGIFAGKDAASAVYKAASAVDNEIEKIDAKENGAVAPAPPTAPGANPGTAAKALIGESTVKPAATLASSVRIDEQLMLNYLTGKGWTLAQAKELLAGHPVKPDTLKSLVAVSTALETVKQTTSRPAARPINPTSGGTISKAGTRSDADIATAYLQRQGWSRKDTHELAKGHPVDPSTLNQLLNISRALPAKTPGAKMKPARSDQSGGKAKSATSTGGRESKPALTKRVSAPPAFPGSSADDYINLSDGPGVFTDTSRNEIRGSSPEDYINLPDIAGESDHERIRGSTSEDYTNLADGEMDSESADEPIKGSSPDDYNSLPDPNDDSSGDDSSGDDGSGDENSSADDSGGDSGDTLLV